MEFKLTCDTEGNNSYGKVLYFSKHYIHLQNILHGKLEMQNNINSLQSNISQQFETLLNKVNSQKGIITELEERVQKSGDGTSELNSNLQSLKNSLECLKDEQEKERNMLEEALKLLTNLASEHSAKSKPQKVMDSAIQTSPGLEKPLSNILEDNNLESTQLTCMSLNTECSQAQDPLQDHRNIIGKRKVTRRAPRMRKKRPLVLSQRARHAVMDENSQPLVNCNRQQKVSMPVCERRNLNMVTSQNSLTLDCQIRPNRGIRPEAAGCLITPLSCWSQDSNSPVCITGIEPILEKLSKRSPEKLQDLWQLFDMDSDSVLDF
ncbi:hypothetical protein GBF38_013442 [Nibea albiflora]|uniref:Uncharacterized protein n=1 Tax=Nibea albiflora TaxID=240163 RepID=A0ACB7F0Q5_NIBAL|nr:hypothetical protein GBF38_013442 [Nibea albiflora]